MKKFFKETTFMWNSSEQSCNFEKWFIGKGTKWENNSIYKIVSSYIPFNAERENYISLFLKKI